MNFDELQLEAVPGGNFDRLSPRVDLYLTTLEGKRVRWVGAVIRLKKTGVYIYHGDMDIKTTDWMRGILEEEFGAYA